LLGAVFPTFTWNILNYGRIKNNVRLQIAKTQELIATYQNTVLSAGREVQTPLRGFLKSREQAEDLDKSVKAATAATELGLQQYRTGTIDFNRVFNLETTQVQQQDQQAVAAGNIALNLVSVYRALGGGWELRCQREGLKRDPALAQVAGPGAARAPAPPPPVTAPPPATAPAPRP
jgi:outer membrane protein TolC